MNKPKVIIQNYRGVRPATVVVVKEGNGTEESPYKEVEYVIGFAEVCGIQRQITLGKITKLTQEEESWFA